MKKIERKRIDESRETEIDREKARGGGGVGVGGSADR